ncbi:serine/arginine repetitive matrix protein 1-like isoform X2 [Ylistrum balloti]|uniref:serine/arginine repetitive matrix protein 1-like isoform X2 n=1 Tax=Ylistrum balloti TaxID=509963 RepID=UPI0029058F38|nr:serine/arginine repetitive matrix protein 1-like isoform X2 [Ylistrum balloti]
MPPAKERTRGHRSQRSYSRSRSRSRSPYQKKSKYVQSRSRSPRPSRRKSPPSKIHQSQHRSYPSSMRKQVPSGKPYNLKRRSRTPSPYGQGSPQRQKLPTRPKTAHPSSQGRDKMEETRRLDTSGHRGRSRSPIYSASKQHRPSTTSRNQDRSPIYTGSNVDRFDPKSRRSWSPEQSFQYSDVKGSSRVSRGRRSPSPGYSHEPGPSTMLFPSANFNSINGPLTIPPSHSNGIKMSLNNRFGFFEENLELPLIIEDNITIGIHRRGPNMISDPRRQIIRNFRPGDSLDIHRKDEGRLPIFDREEIKVFRHDDILDDEVYEEKRTISVAHSKPKNRRDSYESDRRIIQGKSSHYAEPQIKFDPRPDPRYESLLTNTRFRDAAKMTRVQRNPNDLRHSLQKRRHDDDDDEDDQQFDARKKIEAKRKHSHRDDRVHSRERYHDKSGDRQQDRSRSTDRRNKMVTETEVLPDFSNRPGRLDADRYKSEEWKDKPEMIPKNPMYYEHDNREDEDKGYVGRGRYTRRPYRQGFRTRGSYNDRGSSSATYRNSSSTNYRNNNRGSNYKGTNFIPNFRPRGFRRPFNSNYRGRGYHSWNSNWKPASSTSGESVWKHDLYDDKEKGEGDTGDKKDDKKTSHEDSREDNKPTSTT